MAVLTLFSVAPVAPMLLREDVLLTWELMSLMQSSIAFAALSSFRLSVLTLLVS